MYVKGVGPVVAAKLNKMGILTVDDLFHLLPIRYLDRRQINTIREVEEGKEKTIVGTVVAAGIGFVGQRHKRVYEVVLEDESGMLKGIWFHFHQEYMQKKFRVGEKFLFGGDVAMFGHQKQMIHPEVESVGDETVLGEVAGKILPIYPLTEGLYQRQLQRIVRNAWEKFGAELLEYKNELQALHFPTADTDVDLLNRFRSPAHKMLIFDEFFYLELSLAMRRKSQGETAGIAIPINRGRHQKFLDSLPFVLTEDQTKVVEEIFTDMSRVSPMHRLLQGDVGSGKTIVAMAAMLQTVAGGYQAALMVPTEILAEQHFQTLQKWFAPLGIPVRLLTSAKKGEERTSTIEGVATGEIPVLVGTHALIEEAVQFHKLGLVVIDEQHRFGVLQRKNLQQKGATPDVLVMTATPIPRTLALTVYGDLDVSVIRELPKGRKPILTRLYNETQREHLYHGMKMELAKGHQVYAVYPLIEESEKIDLKNATQMYEEIAAHFAPDFTTALLHGKLPSAEKEKIMAGFQKGKTAILVATSVVEVGVDVPAATVMVIEHAERFGLSQLHQLRGRVGRSERQSFCILMADWKRSEEAVQRLKVMVETQDGFRIAEEDLKLRGPGEFLGTRQSGLPEFCVANLVRDFEILEEARDKAFALIQKDPQLSAPEHRSIREVLEHRWRGRLGLAQIG